MEEYNHQTTTGATGRFGDLTAISVFGVDQHSPCRAELNSSIETFALLLHDQKEHLCSYLYSVICLAHCGCEHCKAFARNQEHKTNEYLEWVSNRK